MAARILGILLTGLGVLQIYHWWVKEWQNSPDHHWDASLITIGILMVPAVLLIVLGTKRGASTEASSAQAKRWYKNTAGWASAAFLIAFLIVGIIRPFFDASNGIGSLYIFRYAGIKIEEYWQDWKILAVLSTILMGAVYLSLLNQEQSDSNGNVKQPRLLLTGGLIFVGMGFFWASIQWFDDFFWHLGAIIVASIFYGLADLVRYIDLCCGTAKLRREISSLEANVLRKFHAFAPQANNNTSYAAKTKQELLLELASRATIDEARRTELVEIAQLRNSLAHKKENLEGWIDALDEAKTTLYEVDLPTLMFLASLVLIVFAFDKELTFDKENMPKEFISGMIAATMIVYNFLYVLVIFKVHKFVSLRYWPDEMSGAGRESRPS